MAAVGAWVGVLRTMADENSDARKRVPQHVRKVLARLKQEPKKVAPAVSMGAAEVEGEDDPARGVGGVERPS